MDAPTFSLSENNRIGSEKGQSDLPQEVNHSSPSGEHRGPASPSHSPWKGKPFVQHQRIGTCSWLALLLAPLAAGEEETRRQGKAREGTH